MESRLDQIRIGNAPCSWGTLEFGSLKDDRILWDTMLDELAEAGYTGTELGDWGFFPTDPHHLAAALAERSLDMTGAYVGTRLEDATQQGETVKHNLMIARQLRAVADLNHQDHAPFLVIAADNGSDPVRIQNAGRITPDMELEDGLWPVLGETINRIAVAARDEAGIASVVHFHAAGWIETPREIDRLLEHVGDHVNLVFDTGHFALGAGHADTVLATMDRLASRIGYVHFKDWSSRLAAEVAEAELDYFQAVAKGVFCELGQGDVDFPAVRDWLLRTGYTGYVTVEQDVVAGLGSPFESAQRNRRYLADIGFVN